jgi:hypothetical protein
MNCGQHANQHRGFQQQRRLATESDQVELQKGLCDHAVGNTYTMPALIDS